MFDLLKGQDVSGEDESLLKDLLVLADFEKDAKGKESREEQPFPSSLLSQFLEFPWFSMNVECYLHPSWMDFFLPLVLFKCYFLIA